MSDRMQRLKDKLDNPPLSWCPTGVPEGLDADKCIVSEEVFGTVDEVDPTRISDFGNFTMVTITQDDGKRVAIAGLGTVLAKRFAGVKVNDLLGVRYLGRRPSRIEGQADYHDYAVAVDRTETE